MISIHTQRLCEMAIKSGLIFFTLLLGSLAIPLPEDDIDMSIFFDNSIDTQVGGRIVGGTEAAVGSHPWMVAFTTDAGFRSAHCGGSILTRRTVLSAAHCIVPFRIGNTISTLVRLNVGTNIRNSGGQSWTASHSAVHELYDGNTIKNDIGTIFTSGNMVFNDLVAPIAVSYSHVGGGVAARVAGWGMTGILESPSRELLELEVPTIEGTACANAVREYAASANINAPPVDPNVEICTFIGAGRGTCRGDSGSPLVRIDNGQQIGIVSWGFPCAVGAPDMYVRVSAYQSWIQANTI